MESTPATSEDQTSDHNISSCSSTLNNDEERTAEENHLEKDSDTQNNLSKKEIEVSENVEDTSTCADPDSTSPNSTIVSSPKVPSVSAPNEVVNIDEDSTASTSQTLCTESSTKSSDMLNAEYLKTKYDLSKQNGETASLKRKIELYGPDVGPRIYKIKGNLVTPPVLANNLPEIFKYLPVFGKSKSKVDLENFYSNKIREFVGFDINDTQFSNLAKMCSPEHLRTGKELAMSTPYPTMAMLSTMDKDYEKRESNLCIVKKNKLRLANDPCNNYHKRLKYRGIRLMPLSQMDLDIDDKSPQDLEPGKDVIYHVRIYRPFPYNIKEKHVSTRHSIFSRDVVLLARSRLSALRDRLACANDAGVRLDASENPHDLPTTTAKELFPSGFLFINNVFYVDARGRCADRSAGVRAWAAARGCGDFPAKDLHETRLEDISVRLGHPEVYVHQGNCEHLFTFSEIRLLGPDDPLSSSQYPCHTAVSQNQSVYCTTCAEFGAKWIVTGCATVPFDPAFFCDTCLKMYLYKDDEKVGDFKAYSYRGNEINMLKPQG